VTIVQSLLLSLLQSEAQSNCMEGLRRLLIMGGIMKTCFDNGNCSGTQPDRSDSEQSQAATTVALMESLYGLCIILLCPCQKEFFNFDLS
jgi:hypothetical protein